MHCKKTPACMHPVSLGRRQQPLSSTDTLAWGTLTPGDWAQSELGPSLVSSALTISSLKRKRKVRQNHVLVALKI